MNSISEKAKIYRNVRLVDSEVADFAVVADDSDLANVVMAPHAEFGRRNIIRSTQIGYGSYTGQNTTIRCATIGNYCSISSDVNIYGGGSHDYSHLSMYTDYWFKRTFGVESSSETKLKRTVIGSDVWIGCNVSILGGLTIGDGAVIGAGAVVTKDVEPYSVVVGNPARKIKQRFSEDVVEELLNIRWWDFPPEVLANNVDILKSSPQCVWGGVLDLLRQIKNSLSEG